MSPLARYHQGGQRKFLKLLIHFSADKALKALEIRLWLGYLDRWSYFHQPMDDARYPIIREANHVHSTMPGP